MDIEHIPVPSNSNAEALVKISIGRTYNPFTSMLNWMVKVDGTCYLHPSLTHVARRVSELFLEHEDLHAYDILPGQFLAPVDIYLVSLTQQEEMELHREIRKEYETALEEEQVHTSFGEDVEEFLSELP